MENNSGGAYMTMKYAEREQAEMINLADRVGKEE